MVDPIKTREIRLRNTARRRGFELKKSRRLDPNALSYGTYQLVDIQTNGVVFGGNEAYDGYGASLDDVENYLNGADAS